MENIKGLNHLMKRKQVAALIKKQKADQQVVNLLWTDLYLVQKIFRQRQP